MHCVRSECRCSGVDTSHSSTSHWRLASRLKNTRAELRNGADLRDELNCQTRCANVVKPKALHLIILALLKCSHALHGRSGKQSDHTGTECTMAFLVQVALSRSAPETELGTHFPSKRGGPAAYLSCSGCLWVDHSQCMA